MNKFVKTALALSVLVAGLAFTACDEYVEAPVAPSNETSSNITTTTPETTVTTQPNLEFEYPFPFDAEDWTRPAITGSVNLEYNPGALHRQIGEPLPGEGYAVMRTSHGDVYLRLFPQYAPLAVENFVTHARNGYFDGLIFHRVIEDFMIQGGDPQGTGMGGESIWSTPFGNEFTPNLQHIRGALSMANSDNPQIGRTQTNGSQFFVVQNSGLAPQSISQFQQILDNHMDEYYPGLEDMGVRFRDIFPEDFLRHYIENGGTPHLDFAHTVFGQVFRGMDVVDAIAVVPHEQTRPIDDVVIETIDIRIWE